MYMEHDRFEQSFREIFTPERKEPEKQKLYGVWVEGLHDGEPFAHFLMDDNYQPYFTTFEEAEAKMKEKRASYQVLHPLLSVTGYDMSRTRYEFSVREAP